MAKYDWIGLEKEYILSDYKSVRAFLKDKSITCNGNTNKQTKGWNEKRAIKVQQKSNKVVEKVIEKQSEKEAQEIVDLKSIANTLAIKIKNISNNIDTSRDIKSLTSALKDLNDIIIPIYTEDDPDNSFIKALDNKVGDIWNEKK